MERGGKTSMFQETGDSLLASACGEIVKFGAIEGART